ncbi:DUF6412 domain-containing protein [Streptomyces boncukensis]|uniref:Uncharacterized protein n=1 Tax=Streptomyces boncukensis TaxID=2711219 RepID=A0A6G4X5U0_9ACTN|nr:DUF6412 domain-containing protein [Streptomyces boncukensis]NGO72885.1 hypothetical protein [Streptomyces boncukensis]
MVARTLSAWRMHAAAPLLLLAGFLVAQSGLGTVLGAVAATAAVAVLCAVLLSAGAAPHLAPSRIRTAIRDRERRTAFLPQRDPDAAGRPRPRAPGRLIRTAT